MGRDVAGLCADKKPDVVSPKAKDTTHDGAHVSPRALPESNETKDPENEQIENGKHPEESNDKQNVLGVKRTNIEPEEKIIKAETLRSTGKKSNFPIKTATEHAVNGSSSETSVEMMTPGDNESENNDSMTKSSSNSDDSLSPSSAEKSQPNFFRMLRKHTNKGYYDDDDNCSLASSTTSGWASKFKVTVPVAPKFIVDERLERRKEFYTKLEEKHKALEKERQEHEARITEEEEAVVKQLRKTMVYKANPVPSFYKEGPPPKVELKKLPVTRPKSPNLTRRKSCSDATRSSPEVFGREPHHIVGSYREGKNSTSKSKDLTGVRRSNGTIKSKERAQKPKETIDESLGVDEQDVVAADVAVSES